MGPAVSDTVQAVRSNLFSVGVDLVLRKGARDSYPYGPEVRDRAGNEKQKKIALKIRCNLLR